MRRTTQGFTLIELMSVVAIIAILAAISLPAYNKYRIKSAESACLAETKNYASFALAAIYDQTAPPVPIVGACATIDTATDMNTPIVGAPHIAGARTTTCNMQSGNCALN